MIASLLLVLSLTGPGQAVRTPPPAPSTPELSVLVERVVRLADLQRRKLDLEQELAAKHVGPEHPDAVVLRMQLADLAGAIHREGLQSYFSDAHMLNERRVGLESELARMRLGQQHPEYRKLATQIAAIREQQRVGAVAFLASGGEVEFRALIQRRPDYVQAYLELAALYITAGRTDEGARLLTEAQAALKRSGGR